MPAKDLFPGLTPTTFLEKPSLATQISSQLTDPILVRLAVMPANELIELEGFGISNVRRMQTKFTRVLGMEPRHDDETVYAFFVRVHDGDITTASARYLVDIDLDNARIPAIDSSQARVLLDAVIKARGEEPSIGELTSLDELSLKDTVADDLERSLGFSAANRTLLMGYAQLRTLAVWWGTPFAAAKQ